jgi:tRNA modification GTPase
LHAHDDTITAVATAAGAAGLAVVRLSGSRALETADRVFRGKHALAAASSHTLHHGWAVSPGAQAERIDEVVAAVFRAPRSYTREDVVEFSCHGGALVTRQLLEALLEAGARLAGPGEFTMRAFLNGRLDLSQAEAVADVIHAETHAARDLALSQLAGQLSRCIERIEERLVDAAAEIEARVDFAEDVGGIEVPAHVVETMRVAAAELADLVSGSLLARAVREGLRVPIVGRPNVGKSSLFNALLGEERAIVTAAPGTTRDRVSEALELAGVRVTLSDTAGLRETLDAAEAIGVARSREAIAGCRVALWVLDASEPLAAEDREIAALLAEQRVLIVLNKCDRPRRLDAAALSRLTQGGTRRCVEISAARGDGLGELRGALVEVMGVRKSDAVGVAVSHPRHVEALARSGASLERAIEVALGGEPGEIVALELREAIEALGEITGRRVSEELLERIFSRFCIGK